MMRLNFSSTAALALSAAMIPWLGGCLDGGSRTTLNKGYQELEARNYDDANSDADEFLRAHPNGSGVGEAHYLKGRVDEQKAQDSNVSPTVADKRKWLDSAHMEYETGLQALAPSGVKALLHTGIANVDYYEEDYAPALREWQTAYDNLENDDQKAWVLYHIGRCEQRLGMFQKADQTYADVQRQYPASEAAGRSAARSGATAFYVEVGSFLQKSDAEKAAAGLRGQGLAASWRADSGREVVRIGPISSFQEARAIQDRVHGEYNGAIIYP